MSCLTGSAKVVLEGQRGTSTKNEKDVQKRQSLNVEPHDKGLSGAYVEISIVERTREDIEQEEFFLEIAQFFLSIDYDPTTFKRL